MADLTGHDDRAPRRVRAWYGLPGEIVIEAGHCHPGTAEGSACALRVNKTLSRR